MRQMISLLCTLFLLGCIPNESRVEPSQADRDFFRQPTSVQVKKFNELGPEAQYELLIVGNQLVHPPALYLVEEFARQGKVVIPFLRSKLTNANKDVTIRDVVAILSEMQRMGSYEVKSDATLMALVEEKLAAMQGQWKPVTQRMLEEIREN